MTRILDDGQLANISGAGAKHDCEFEHDCGLQETEKGGGGPGQAADAEAPGNDPGELNRRF